MNKDTWKSYIQFQCCKWKRMLHHRNRSDEATIGWGKGLDDDVADFLQVAVKNQGRIERA